MQSSAHQRWATPWKQSLVAQRCSPLVCRALLTNLRFATTRKEQNQRAVDLRWCIIALLWCKDLAPKMKHQRWKTKGEQRFWICLQIGDLYEQNLAHRRCAKLCQVSFLVLVLHTEGDKSLSCHLRCAKPKSEKQRKSSKTKPGNLKTFEEKKFKESTKSLTCLSRKELTFVKRNNFALKESRATAKVMHHCKAMINHCFAVMHLYL